MASSSSIPNFSPSFSSSKFPSKSKLVHFYQNPSTKSLQLPQILNQNPTFSTSQPQKPKLSFKNFKNSSFSPPQKTITHLFAEKIVFLLLGCFVFIGSFNARPVIALPTQESVDVVEEESQEEEAMYVKLLDGNPGDVEALKMVVNVMMRNGKTEEGVKYVRRLIELQPDEVEWRLLEALCFEMMGQLSKAKTLFKDILKTRPLLLRALHGLAMVMHKNLEGPAVFGMLNRALELARREKRVSEERNIRILIAQMHVVKGELEEALGKFEILVNENPRDFRPYLCQGIIFSLLEKKKEAEERFEIYRSLVPEEFPQRGFLDDVMIAAKTESRQQLEEDLKS